jgi:Endoglucanase
LGGIVAVSGVKGFVKADGQKLINGEGCEILLRGVGLGGWLLPEGYMWCFPEHVDRPRRMEKMIEDLVGKEKAKKFWKNYFEGYTTEADIQKIASEGFNSIRVPINSRQLFSENQQNCFCEEHLQLIDRVVGWCKKYGLYVILDLHGAPGGQTGTNIDDSEYDKPELFTNEDNKLLTIKIWRMLAERYKDEWTVAGYDLLNEPLPDWFSEYNGQVMPLYMEIVKAIREVDKNHMIILEGVHWSTDWSIFKEKPDDNLMLQFHKYWNNPDTESIQVFLDKRKEWNVPIFMGEGGENNKEWLTGAFRLYEDHNISWNFWTWKKMNRDNSPCSIKMPENWDILVNYIKGGVKPDEVTVENILNKFINNLSLDMCEYHPEIINALFCRPPILIPAIFYGYKGDGVSFGVYNTKVSQIDFRVKDEIDIQFVDGLEKQPNFKHMAGEPWKTDEWMYIQLADQDEVSYEITVDAKSMSFFFMVNLCVKAIESQGYLFVIIDGSVKQSAELIKVDPSWEIVSLTDAIYLEPGTHTIVIKAKGNPVGLKWLEVQAKLL